jgi:PAS domain S-box-containing protein
MPDGSEPASVQEVVSVLLVGAAAQDGAFEGDRFDVTAVSDAGDAPRPDVEADVAVVSGDAVERAVRRLDVPVVAVADDGAAALAAGADECVPADPPPRVLANRVRSVAERERRRRRERALLADPLTARTVVDGDGRVVDANEAAVSFAGQGRQAVLGEVVWELPWAERSPPSAVDAYRELVERAHDGEVARDRVQARDPGGARRPFDVVARPLHGDRVVLEGRDATTIADPEASLDPPSRRLRTVIENLPVVLFALDADGRFTLSEGRALERLGFEPGEVDGESVFDVYADHPDVVDAVERALDGEHVQRVLDLGDLAFETWYRPVETDGEVRRVIGVAVDVTGRVERERDLKQYETIVETIPDGVFVLDDEGVMRGGNERAARMFGYGYEDLIDAPFYRLVEEGVVDESVIERYVGTVRDLLSSDADREKGRIEFDVHPPDGGRRVVEIHVAPRIHDGEFAGTIGVVRDVTERHERERQLRRQNERLDEFAGVVSHDLRNPLGVARGTADLLADEVDAEGVDRIQRSLRRMDDLVENLLELARSGRTVTETSAVELDAAVADAWGTVAASDGGLVVDTDAVVAADRSRLRQLLENLLANAVEHGGASPRVEVGDLPGGHGFYVADDGPGIPESERERVLEYGYSTDEDGTGLGLAIVRSVAEAHGWTVEVSESEAGGARFAFREVEPAE